KRGRSEIDVHGQAVSPRWIPPRPRRGAWGRLRGACRHCSITGPRPGDNLDTPAPSILFRRRSEPINQHISDTRQESRRARFAVSAVGRRFDMTGLRHSDVPFFLDRAPTTGTNAMKHVTLVATLLGLCESTALGQWQVQAVDTKSDLRGLCVVSPD